MKIKRKRLRKVVAMFLLVNFLQSLLLPTLANALTSGPTAPEATSFEPVDTTDMVNLQTGDFTYNMPLLEVPGPEGGYPLSLAYHAGIKPLEDASWVGLGWSLNPGAINRTVNGFPDDFKNVTRVVEDQWIGGESHSFSAGIGIGLPSGLKADLAYTASFDTYQGFNGAVSLGIQAGYGRLGIGTQASWNSSGFSVDSPTLKAGAFNFNTDGSGGSVSLGLGISISSKNGNRTLSVAGSSIRTINNNYALSTKSIKINATPALALIGLPITARYNYTRYWTDEKDNVNIYGSLYARSASDNWTSDDANYDNTQNHDLIDGADNISFDAQIHSKPRVDNGQSKPMMPSYDSYNLLGQGIGGSFSPKIFESKSLFKQKVVRRDGSGDVEKVLSNYIIPSNGEFTENVKFRFDYDFSNSYQFLTNPSMDVTINSAVTNVSNNSGTFQAGKDVDNYNGFDNQYLAGSKHIKYYINDDIGNNPIGNLSTLFIGYPNNLNSKRLQNDYKNQIGGFSITKADGVTYHYGLPVYSYGEYDENVKIIDTNNGGSTNSYHKETKNTPYAYTWLLTAVTGPDFVDRGTFGEFDEDDWGYWVKFDYGLWTDQYEWRAPFEGYTVDINGRSKHFSYGKKEIYYLDAIKTRTHTALFVKDIRNDAKGITGRDGGCDIENEKIGICRQEGVYQGEYTDIDLFAPTGLPISQLKLDNVLLLKNDKLKTLIGSDYLNTLKGNFTSSLDEVTFNLSDISYNHCDYMNHNLPLTKYLHRNGNVITKEDILGLNLEANSLKSIEFNTDYSLAPETPNSFDHSNLYQGNPSIPNEKSGKLTLNSVSVKGYGNQSVIPPTNFDYENEALVTTEFEVIDGNTIEIDNPTAFKAGDIIQFTIGNETYYCLLLNDGVNVDVEFLGKNKTINSSMSGEMKKCYNPPFNAQKYDYWGYYKPDYNDTQNLSPGSLLRTPSTLNPDDKPASSWSLKSVLGATGAKLNIEYETKEYDNIVVDNGLKFHIKSSSAAGTYWNTLPNQMTLEFHDKADLTKYFNAGDVIDIRIPVFYYDCNFNCSSYNYKQSELVKTTVNVQSVSSNSLVIDNYSIGTMVGDYDVYSVDNSGFIEMNSLSNELHRGGGIRIKSLESVNASTGEKSTTQYKYNGGTISYKPYGSSMILPDDGKEEITSLLIGAYIYAYTASWDELMDLVGFIPAPVIMYENVEVTQKNNDIPIPGRQEYNFRVFDKSMLTYTTNEDNAVGGHNQHIYYNHLNTEFEIHDKTAQFGNLMSMEVFNGEEQLINSTSYNYIDDGGIGESENDYSQYKNQGVIHQSFNEIRRFHLSNTKLYDYSGSIPFTKADILNSSTTVYKKYPAILASTTTVNNGITTTSYNKKFDFYTGEPIEVETENSYGEKFRATSTPAYHEYPDMGLKIDNSNKKHMLTQNTATKLERLNSSGGVAGTISASATTWNNWTDLDGDGDTDGDGYTDGQASLSVWRKHKSYVYQESRKDEDGTFTSFTAFSWDSDPAPNWIKTSEITLYDHYSKPLEVKDMNDDYAATKMGYNETMPIASVVNGKYKEFAYAGAEEGSLNGNTFDGGVQLEGGVVSSSQAMAPHTGEYSVQTTGKGFLFETDIDDDALEEGRYYRASVWVNTQGNNNSNAQLSYKFKNGSSGAGQVSVNATDIQAGSWKLVTLDFEIPYGTKGDMLEVRAEANGTLTFFDDFRFHPLDGPMTSYVYDNETGQVRFILDAENFFTEYTYAPDGSGRLEKVYRETTETASGRRLITKHKMNYKRDF